MKLKDSVIVTEIADEKMLVEVNADSEEAFHGLVKLNGTAAFIVDALAQDTTVEDITAKVLTEYEGADAMQIENDVRALIEKLRGIGLIVD